MRVTRPLSMLIRISPAATPGAATVAARMTAATVPDPAPNLDRVVVPIGTPQLSESSSTTTRPIDDACRRSMASMTVTVTM